jgi:hypothetical protein
MKKIHWPDAAILAWLALVVYAYAIFTNYTVRPGFVATPIKALFNLLAADYLK